MQHERISFRPQIRDNEGQPVCHEAGDKGHVTAKPAEFRHHYLSLGLTGPREGSAEFRATFQGIRPLAGFNLNMLRYNPGTLSGGKPGNGFALRLGPEAGLALLIGAHSNVRDYLVLNPAP